MAADEELMTKIKDILKRHFKEDYVDVSPSGIRDNIHVLVISREFDGMTERQKQEFLWSFIDESELSEDQKLRISMILPLSPAEIR